MSLAKRVWAGVGSAAIAGIALAPMSSAATPVGHPAASKQAATSAAPALGAPTPLDPTSVVLTAFANRFLATYHLPPAPPAGATTAQLQAYAGQVLQALHLPAFPTGGTQAEGYAWLTQAAKALGLSDLPALDAPGATWDAWYTKNFGMTPQDFLNGLGAQATIERTYCVQGHQIADVAAINLADTPRTVDRYIDGIPTGKSINLPASLLGNPGVTHYEDSFIVPAGKHVLMLKSNGQTIATATAMGCGTCPTHHGSHPGTGSHRTQPSKPTSPSTPVTTTKPAPVNTIPAKQPTAPTRPVAPVKPAGPIVQTDHVASSSMGTNTMLEIVGATLVAAAAGGALTRAKRR